VASWKVQITCKDATAKVITVKKVVGWYVGHHLLIQLCIDLLWTLARVLLLLLLLSPLPLPLPLLLVLLFESIHDGGTGIRAAVLVGII